MKRYIGAEDPDFGGMPDRDYLHDIYPLDGEPDNVYIAFRKLVGAYITNDDERPFYTDLQRQARKLGRSRLSWRQQRVIVPEHSGTPEVLPPIVEREYSAEFRRRHDKRAKGFLLTLGSVVASGTMVAMALSANVHHDEQQDYSARNSVAMSADYLRTLGICEADMRLQEATDKQDLSIATGNAVSIYKNYVAEDITAIQTAHDASLPCIGKPDDTSVKVLGMFGGIMPIARVVMTAYGATPDPK